VDGTDDVSLERENRELEGSIAARGKTMEAAARDMGR
jgi:hypothetical protein